MTTLAPSVQTKFQAGAAACAIAAAAALIPVAARAAPAIIPAPTAPMTSVFDNAPMALTCFFGQAYCTGAAVDLKIPITHIVDIPLLGFFVPAGQTVFSFGLSAKQGAYGSLSVGIHSGGTC